LGVSITFRDATHEHGLQEELARSNQERETAYEELQSANEELETTNEELQSTVEELQTTNEELQSSNEEMETMNEELQATNEELQTMNAELRRNDEDLDQMNSFLQSILASVHRVNGSGSEVVCERPGKTCGIEGRRGRGAILLTWTLACRSKNPWLRSTARRERRRGTGADASTAGASPFDVVSPAPCAWARPGSVAGSCC
jgi:hypothetical protein